MDMMSPRLVLIYNIPDYAYDKIDIKNISKKAFNDEVFRPFLRIFAINTVIQINQNRKYTKQ